MEETGEGMEQQEPYEEPAAESVEKHAASGMRGDVFHEEKSAP